MKCSGELTACASPFPVVAISAAEEKPHVEDTLANDLQRLGNLSHSDRMHCVTSLYIENLMTPFYHKSACSAMPNSEAAMIQQCGPTNASREGVAKAFSGRESPAATPRALSALEQPGLRAGRKGSDRGEANAHIVRQGAES